MSQMFEVTVYGELFGQKTVNRFNYVSGDIPSDQLGSFALVTAMGLIPTSGAFPVDTIGYHWQQNIHQAFRFLGVYARDLFVDTDLYEASYPAGVVGIQTGECLSPVMAIGFRTNRVVQSIARGTKRLAGVPEAQVGSGGELTTAAQGSYNVLASFMSATLSYTSTGGSSTFEPAVLQLKEYETPSGKRAYKLYPTPTEQLQHAAYPVTWSLYIAARSQVSRQYGRGN